MRRIVLAGGSGFLGTALAGDLGKRDFEIVNLTRRPRAGGHGMRDVEWDGKTAGPWAALLDGAAAVVNLTGKSVDCRYNAQNRAEIIRSRVDSVGAIGAALRQCAVPPPVWVQASSMAVYGDTGDRICDEQAPHGTGFAVDVCQRWEGAVAEQTIPATRTVVLRIDFVLGRGGGALQKLAGLARKGLGGTVGSGKQWMSWIHVDDMNRMVSWAIDNAAVSGVYNATGPAPVRNADFMRALRTAVGAWFGPPAPALAVRIGSFFLGTDPSLALTGRRCIPARTLSEGFAFRNTELVPTLETLLRPS